MGFGIDEVDKLFEVFDEKCSKALAAYQNELKAMRAGRANPHILDKVTVSYYGVDTPLNQMANISIAEARVLVVSVWDKSALKDVEKAIIAANLGIMPNNDGSVIRLVFPEITEEKRKQLVKEIKVLSENVKVALRNARRDAIDGLKKLEKNSTITEDDLKDLTKDVDKKLDNKIEEVEKLFKQKEQEVMSV